MKLKENTYQLVILDVMIRDEYTLPILMLTSKHDSTSKVRGLRASFELPPKEFDLLLFLAKHQGKILTKRQIYEEVWKESYVYDDNNIMAIISRIRKKIEENPGCPKYIQTVKGIGYRFNREV